jgi:hypothetical protein
MADWGRQGARQIRRRLDFGFAAIEPIAAARRHGCFVTGSTPTSSIPLCAVLERAD